jgi:hypothetical protein
LPKISAQGSGQSATVDAAPAAKKTSVPAKKTSAPAAPVQSSSPQPSEQGSKKGLREANKSSSNSKKDSFSGHTNSTMEELARKLDEMNAMNAQLVELLRSKVRD